MAAHKREPSGGGEPDAPVRASTVIKPTVQRVADLLGPCGFRKRARRFNRRTPDDGIVHVIAVQLARHEGFEAPGSHGMHPGYYGTYTVNIGVYIPEVAWWPPSPGGWVAEYDCPISTSIGALLPEPKHTWWPVGSVDAADVVLDALGSRVLPWLDRLSSVEAILRMHDLAPELLGTHVQASSWPYELYLSRGRTEEARSAFAAHLAHGPWSPNAVSNLRSWLHAHELHDWEPMLNAVQVEWR
jgi:hypothetical protein